MSTDQPIALEPRAGARARLHPRLLAAAVLVSLVMVPVAMLLAEVGVLALRLAGGADSDTKVVLFIAAVAVTDFWGGGLVLALTRAPRRQVAIAWGIARALLLAIASLVSMRITLVAPVMLLLAVPSALLGARTSAAYAALRRQGAVAASAPPASGGE